MITKEIARLIFHCYSEIENSHKMIDELKKSINEKGEVELKDNWGCSKTLELRIPTPSGGHSIKQLPFELALTVINQHIEKQHEELQRLKEVCKIQLA